MGEKWNLSESCFQCVHFVSQEDDMGQLNKEILEYKEQNFIFREVNLETCSDAGIMDTVSKALEFPEYFGKAGE